jgi:hypothetical protein
MLQFWDYHAIVYSVTFKTWSTVVFKYINDHVCFYYQKFSDPKALIRKYTNCWYAKLSELIHINTFKLVN